MSKNVLVGFADALSAPEVVWSLAQAGHTVIAFARRDAACALRSSRAVTIFEIAAPESDLGQALRDLRQKIAGLSGDWSVMPLDDKAIFLVEQLALPPERIVGASRAQAMFALDKRQQVEAARQAGFALPATIMVETVEQARSYAGGYPVIFKPSLAVAAADNRLTKSRSWMCQDRGELGHAIGEWQGREPMLIQAIVTGDGVGIFGLAAESGVLIWSSHRRVRMMNPHGSGSSACRAVPLLPELQAAAGEFLRLARWRGLFMIELLHDVDGTFWFMEFNGRPWGSMALARKIGLEYPAWAVRLGEDASFRPPANALAPNAEKILCRHLGRELLHVLFVIKGPKSKSVPRWPGVWRTLGQVCWIRQGDRWYNWQRGDLKVFFRDTWLTVAETVFPAKKRSA